MLFLLMFIEIVFLILLQVFYCSNFPFGLISTLIFVVLNLSMLFIRVFVVDATIIPKNDPGITIYWLCCLRFGQRGKYTEKYKIGEVKRNI